MTAKQFAEWVLSLPEEQQNSELFTITWFGPSQLKRAVSFHYKSDPASRGVYVNGMGTHASDEFLGSIQWDSYLAGDGRVLTPSIPTPTEGPQCAPTGGQNP